MSTIATNKGGDFEKPDPGNYAAVCVAVIDLGTHRNVRWNKMEPKICIGWEIDEARQDGKHFCLFGRYTLTTNEKGLLRPMLESWRGRAFTDEEVEAFNVKNVLGKPCLVNVVHSADGKYANVKTVTPAPKGMATLVPSGSLIYFSVDAPDMAVFEKFGDNLKKTIQESEEWKARHGTALPGGHDDMPVPDDDSVPF